MTDKPLDVEAQAIREAAEQGKCTHLFPRQMVRECFLCAIKVLASVLAACDEELKVLRQDRRALLDAIAGELPDIGADRTVELAVKELAGLSDAFEGAVRLAIKEREAAESRAANLEKERDELREDARLRAIPYDKLQYPTRQRMREEIAALQAQLAQKDEALLALDSAMLNHTCAQAYDEKEGDWKKEANWYDLHKQAQAALRQSVPASPAKEKL